MVRLSSITLFEEPLEEKGNGTVYGTIQDGGGKWSPRYIIYLNYSEPLEETGNGTVYGTIQDGGGNGLVVLTQLESAEPNGAHDILFIKIIQSPWRRRGTVQCTEQSMMAEGMDWLYSPRRRGLSQMEPTI